MVGTWCTAADVMTYAGVTATDDDVARAQAQIDVFCGLTFDAAAAIGVSPRDLYWLKLATAYQAGWMVSQPDLFSRQSVATISQDGLSIGYEMRGGETADSGQIMAPMARRALRRLRWMGTRAMRLRRDRSDFLPGATRTLGTDPLRDTNDETDPYVPMAGWA